MGTSISGVLVVGLPFDEVCEDYEDFCTHYDHELDRISPYYDADDSDCIVGYTVSSGYYAASPVLDEQLGYIEGFKERFKKLTGKDAQLYVSPNVD